MKTKEECRFISLYELYLELNAMMEWGGKVSLNKNLLRVAVISYFKDIIRYKTFHKTENADQHKKAAFTIKWISKIRPISVLIDNKEITKKELLCNQLFAVIAGLSFLEIDITQISEKFFEHLLYTCQYRDIDCQQMSTSMYLLETSLNNQTP